MNLKDWFSSKFADERVRYIFIGVINTVFGFLLFTALFFSLNKFLHYIWIYILTQVIAVTFSHFTQRHYVWHSAEDYLSELSRFAATYVVVSFANIALLTFAVEVLDLSALTSQYVIGLLLILSTFFFQKYWVFKKST